MRSKLGPRPAAWRWGALHKWRLPHPLGAVPGLGRWFSRGPYPFPGDVNTVLQGGMALSRDTDNVSILPGYRQIIDLADLDRSVFILSTGNSGIPGHPHYGDCIDEFLRGQYRPLLYSRTAVESQVAHTLVLDPA
jgi:penicillin amidase